MRWAALGRLVVWATVVGSACSSPSPTESPAAGQAAGLEVATIPADTSAPPDDGPIEDDHAFHAQSVYLEQLEELLTLGRFDEVKALLDRSDLSGEEKAVYEAAAATGLGEPVPAETRELVQAAAKADELPEVTRKRAALVLAELPAASPVISGNPIRTRAETGGTTSGR